MTDVDEEEYSDSDTKGGNDGESQDNDDDPDYANISIDMNCWVIIDNIPGLKKNDDFLRHSTNIQEACKLYCKNNVEPIVYIPHERVEDEYKQISIKIDGCALVSFPNRMNAEEFEGNFRKAATLQKQEYRNLAVYTYDKFNDYINMPDKFVKMKPNEYQNQRCLLWWLKDEEPFRMDENTVIERESFRDQFVLRFTASGGAEETHIYWFDKDNKNSFRELCYDGEREKREHKVMTQQYVQWSPKGSYLVTFHLKGIQMWGGPEWISLLKLEHAYVDRVNFSPNEKYLVTLNVKTVKRQKPKIRIWDTFNGDMLAELEYDKIGPSIKMNFPGWYPIIKWSYNGNYFAKFDSTRKMLAKPKDIDKITIYKLDGLHIEKLGRKSLLIGQLFNMEFSPIENILGYTTTTDSISKKPAQLTLIEIPSKKQIRSQALGFDVKFSHLYWDKFGEYIAVKLTHNAKGRQKLQSTIGIMSIKHKDKPFTRTKKYGLIHCFSWQINSYQINCTKISRFAFLHGNKKSPNATFYNIINNNNNGTLLLKELFTIKNKKSNEIFWSPNGSHCVIAFLDETGKFNARIEFIDINKCDTIIEREHESCNYISWSPCGKYLCTAAIQTVGSYSDGDDTGYKIWSFQGDLLYDCKIKMFYQFLWRLRPTLYNLFNENILQNMINSQNNLKNIYMDKFLLWDKMRKDQTQSIEMKLHKNQKKIYNKIKNDIINNYKDNIIQKRLKLIGTSLKKINSEYQIKIIQKKLVKSWKKILVDKKTLERHNDGNDVDWNSLKVLQQG